MAAEAPAGLGPVEHNEADEGSEGDEDEVTAEGQERRKKKKKEVEAVMEEEVSEMWEAPSLSFLDKNTSSFRCLAQVLMSSSSLMKQRMRFFPPLEDPGLDLALNFVPPELVSDSTGSFKYWTVCKEHNIVPITRVLHSLGTQELNLKYYGISPKQTEAICRALMINSEVTRLILQDNWLSLEAVQCLADMLTENNTIQYLNLRECRIGPEGAARLNEGIMTNQCLREIDLSFNSLGDEGMKKLQSGLIENTSIEIINLSHNYLGDGACEVLAKVLTENHNIEVLDLSWNSIFSTPGLKILSTGLRASPSLRSLNLAWNTITLRPAVKWLMRYMKKSPFLEHLDLSNNRLAGGALKMIRAGIFNSPSLISVRLGNNIFTPDDAMFFLQIFVAKPKIPLKEMDLENVYVNKDFVPIMKRLQARGKIITIGGVLKNYEIKGPDINQLLFERARYLGMKPKQKKKKKDFGLFVLMLPDKNVTKQEFQKIFKANKMKMIDEDFRKELMGRFPYKKNKISLSDLKEDYLRRYPDTVLPPKKKKKGKKGKKKKKKGEGDAAAAAPGAEAPAAQPPAGEEGAAPPAGTEEGAAQPPAKEEATAQETGTEEAATAEQTKTEEGPAEQAQGAEVGTVTEQAEVVAQDGAIPEQAQAASEVSPEAAAPENEAPPNANAEPIAEEITPATTE